MDMPKDYKEWSTEDLKKVFNAYDVNFQDKAYHIEFLEIGEELVKRGIL